MTNSESFDTNANRSADTAYEAIADNMFKSLSLGILAQAGRPMAPTEILEFVVDIIDDPQDPDDGFDDEESRTDTAPLVEACQEMQQAGLVIISQTDPDKEPQVELTPLGEQVGVPTAGAIMDWYAKYGRVVRSEKELDIIKQIIVGGGGTLESLAKTLGVGLEKVGEAMGQLIRSGLVRRQPGAPSTPQGPPTRIPRDAPLPRPPFIPPPIDTRKAPQPPAAPAYRSRLKFIPLNLTMHGEGELRTSKYDPVPPMSSVYDRPGGYKPSSKPGEDTPSAPGSDYNPGEGNGDSEGAEQDDRNTPDPGNEPGGAGAREGSGAETDDPKSTTPGNQDTYDIAPGKEEAAKDLTENVKPVADGDPEALDQAREWAKDLSQDQGFLKGVLQWIRDTRERRRNRDYQWQTEPEEDEDDEGSGSGGSGTPRPDLNPDDFGGMDITGTIEQIKAAIILVANKLDANSAGSMLSALRFLEESTRTDLNNAQHVVSLAEKVVSEVASMDPTEVPYTRLLEAVQAQQISEEWTKIYKEIEHRQRNLPEVILYVQNLLDKINGIKDRL